MKELMRVAGSLACRFRAGPRIGECNKNGALNCIHLTRVIKQQMSRTRMRMGAARRWVEKGDWQTGKNCMRKCHSQRLQMPCPSRHSAGGSRQSGLQLPICHAPRAVHNAKQASAVRRRRESVGRSSSYNEM